MLEAFQYPPSPAAHVALVQPGKTRVVRSLVGNSGGKSSGTFDCVSAGGTIKSLFATIGDGRLFNWVVVVAAKRWVGVLLALYAFATDGLTGWNAMNFAMRGLLDEPAHLATALIVLGALVRVRGARPDQRFGWAMLACSVLIDIDHLPAELGTGALTSGTPRPYTHALWTVIALTLVWVAARSFRIRLRQPRLATVELIAAGAASGVAAHFIRDIATAPMSFWWPASDLPVQVPYWWYVTALSVFIAIGPVRRGLRLGNAATRATCTLDTESSNAKPSPEVWVSPEVTTREASI